MQLKEAIDAADRFFSGVPARRGDRVTVRREPSGQTVTWVVSLDRVECGRISLSPWGERWNPTITYTSIARGTAQSWPAGEHISEIEQERFDLLDAIWNDLYYGHLGGPSGTVKPGIRVKHTGPEYWSEADDSNEQPGEPPEADGEPMELRLSRRKPGAKPDENYDRAYAEVAKGRSLDDAYDWFCGITNTMNPDKGFKDAFMKAMKRRRDKQT